MVSIGLLSQSISGGCSARDSRGEYMAGMVWIRFSFRISPPQVISTQVSLFQQSINALGIGFGKTSICTQPVLEYSCSSALAVYWGGISTPFPWQFVQVSCLPYVYPNNSYKPVVCMRPSECRHMPGALPMTEYREKSI